VDHDVSRDRGAGPVTGRALVTGAARGLGRGIAARLIADGWGVALMDVAPEVEATAAELASARPEATAVPLVGDVSDDDASRQAAEDAAAALGGLDSLVNNAGIGGPLTDVVDTDPVAFRRVLEVNLVGPFLMARAVVPKMVAGGRGGVIVNIGSILGQRGSAGAAAYCASKGGIELLTHSLALELAPFAIRVNTIAPGNMATEMHFDDVRATAEAKGTSFDEELDRVRGTVPLGRHGTADDIAAAAAWLLSDDASYVTGQTIGVNGGVVLT
jgi:NAD(P)-dependent dehydrogenase (short-subunit alcohol dehydrogenase family)